MTETRQDKQVELGSLSSTFKIEVEILKTEKPTQSQLIVLDVQNRGRNEILKTNKPTQSCSIIFEVQGQGQIFEFSIKPKKLFKMDQFQGVKSSSPLKTLVNDLTSMEFVRDRLPIQDIIQAS